METTANATEENYYAFINDESLTREERYELALLAALDMAHLDESQLDGYADQTRQFIPARPDMAQLVAEAKRTGRAQWGVGIIAVGSVEHFTSTSSRPATIHHLTTAEQPEYRLTA